MEEVWKPVVGYPGYEVSCFGRLRSLRRRSAKILKGQRGTHGYLQTLLIDDKTGAKHYVSHHIAVAEAFHGAKPVGQVVRHCNGQQTDNRAENLRWGTYSENALDKHQHGTMRCGDGHEWSKLTDEQVMQIDARLREGERVSDLAREYGVAHGVISGINRGAGRAYLTGRTASSRLPTRPKKLTPQQVDEIVKKLKAGVRQRHIAAEYSVKPQTVSCIATGKAWSWRTGITKVLGED